MKHSKLTIILFTSLLALAMLLLNLYEVNAYSYKLKKIRTISVDTTGDKAKEKVEILADEENKGYIAKVIHGADKVYELKPAKEFKFLAPYTPFWKLNIIIADINSDSVPEIIYLQWQDNKYKKIYYEFDGFRGFPIINQLFAIMPVTQPYLYTKDVLDNIFSDEWISNINNLELLEEFNKDLLSIQITDYVNARIEYKNKVPIKETWKFKVKTYRIIDTTVVVKESTMIADMKITNSIDGKDIWRIDNIAFVE